MMIALPQEQWRVFGTMTAEELARWLVEFGRSVRFETRCPMTGRWIEANACPSPEGLSVYFRDITRRKDADTEQARLRQELETG
jgi:hypothetical protein